MLHHTVNVIKKIPTCNNLLLYVIENVTMILSLYISASYTKILEVNLFAFAYRLFRRDFSPLDGTYCNMSRRVGRNLYETVCRQMQTN